MGRFINPLFFAAEVLKFVEAKKISHPPIAFPVAIGFVMIIVVFRPDKLRHPRKNSQDESDRLIRPSRSEERVVTIGYYSLVKMHDYIPVASSFARSAVWVPVNEVAELAFDHNILLDKALSALRQTLQTRPIGFNLLPPKFTLSQLQRLYEAIHNRDIDKRNFRRKIIKLGIVTELAEKQEGVAHKPARFFSFDKDRYEELLQEGFENFKL